MRPELRTGLALGMLLLTSIAQAQPAATATAAKPAATARPSATSAASAAPSAKASAALPPGHPTTGTDPHAQMPVDPGDEAPQANPHADPHAQAGRGGGDGGPPPPPEDVEEPDLSLPAGTITVRIVDGDNKPLPKTEVTLGILENSVAKGENRKRITKTTDEQGFFRFDGLATGTGIAYRVTVVKDLATFALMPFQLPDKGGMRTELHVYPVTRDIEKAVIVMQSAVFFDLKDDRVQAEQAFMIYNFGRTAWVPDDLVVPLPEAAMAVTSQQGMSDVGVDPVEKRGVRIRGTFGPGRHEIQFRWQLPYAGEDTLNIEVGMPPHMASARVIATAATSMRLEVAGFPASVTQPDGQGQRVLISEKQMAREEPPLKNVKITLAGIPQTGLPKTLMWAASGGTFLLLAFAITLGVQAGSRRKKTAELKSYRDVLLADIEELERARLAGDIGPKTYERARRELTSELARTFAGTGDKKAAAPAAATA